MNPFYTSTQQMQGFNNPFGDMFNLIQQFNAFKQSFQGNPKEKVQELLNSGQMTQEQFNQLSQMAQQFRQFVS